MYKFSDFSMRNLDKVDTRLLRVIYRAIKVFDFQVICGVRGAREQDLAFSSGRSKLKFPNSKHNIYPPERFESEAVDIVPYPVPKRWGAILKPTEYLTKAELMIDIAHRSSFYFLAGVVKSIAVDLGVHIRWGGDFNDNLNFEDDSFLDLVHFELV